MRISRPQMFMEIAHTVAKRATCMRLSVGAIIVHQRNIISIGYNGVPPRAPHCQGNSCPGKLVCHETTHAEMNALQRVPRELNGSLDIYCTDSPCQSCYQALIADSRVHRIFFGIPYRITDHLMQEFWNAPEVYRITPSGYVMNWRTKELVEVVT